LGEQLVTLWEFETGHNWKESTSPQPITVLASLADDEQGCLPESYFIGEGLELIRWNWTGEKIGTVQKATESGRRDVAFVDVSSATLAGRRVAVYRDPREMAITKG
jgi:hypothetical protein